MNLSEHGTIIETENEVKKSLVICLTQFAGSVLLTMPKCFEVMLHSFTISRE